MQIDFSVQNLIEYVTTIRRQFHRIPELSDVEHDTSDLIAQFLTELGHDFMRIDTGIVCDISGADTSRRVAFRCDIDALPIFEQNNIDFVSQNSGCMHACGHDGHIAIMLGLAKMLSKQGGGFVPNTNVRIIFQYGEEGSGGAERMIEQGAIEGIDEIFAFHLSPKHDKGTIATRDGALFAGAVEFDINFLGKSSHCASRNEGIDALSAGIEACRELGNINSEFPSCLIHVGAVKSGSARNIVANDFEAKCTLRYFDIADKQFIMSKIQYVLDHIAAKSNATFKLTVIVDYPPLINSSSSVNYVKQLFPEIIEAEAQYTAEDFAFYLLKINGCMMWLGIRDEQFDSPLHSDTFNFDESSLLYGIQLLHNMLTK